MEIIEMRIGDLIPYENNPRKNDDAVSAVAASIREFGFKVPIIVDKNNVIVAGHTRLKAAKSLGMKTVPVIRADDLTEEQVTAFRLADNKTGEIAEWDFSALETELSMIPDIDMADFGFAEELHSFFTDRKRYDTSRQDGNEEYNEFLDKFETKKTTDDCYTPDGVYEAVADWVCKEYGVKRKDFVRPFYPGGDYEKFTYLPGVVVVDNPPFSILAEIVRFYAEKNIKFFLFAPSLTLFSSSSSSSCAIGVGVGITYENGAVVSTSFLTNLENKRFRSAPELYKAVKAADDITRAEMRKELPKYDYPDEVMTSTKLAYFSKYGVDFSAGVEETERIGTLDAQREEDKSIYGNGYLMSGKKAAEKAAAEKAAALKWKLSDREKEIVARLSKM